MTEATKQIFPFFLLLLFVSLLYLFARLVFLRRPGLNPRFQKAISIFVWLGILLAAADFAYRYFGRNCDGADCRLLPLWSALRGYLLFIVSTSLYAFYGLFFRTSAILEEKSEPPPPPANDAEAENQGKKPAAGETDPAKSADEKTK